MVRYSLTLWNLAKVTTEVDTARAFSRKAGNRSCTGTTAHKKFPAFFRPLLAFFSLYAVYKLCNNPIASHEER